LAARYLDLEEVGEVLAIRGEEDGARVRTPARVHHQGALVGNLHRLVLIEGEAVDVLQAAAARADQRDRRVEGAALPGQELEDRIGGLVRHARQGGARAAVAPARPRPGAKICPVTTAAASDAWPSASASTATTATPLLVLILPPALHSPRSGTRLRTRGTRSRSAPAAAAAGPRAGRRAWPSHRRPGCRSFAPAGRCSPGRRARSRSAPPRPGPGAR